MPTSMSRSFRIAIFGTMVGLIGACSDTDDQPASPGPRRLTVELDTALVLDAAGGPILARPVSVAVDRRGRLIIGDRSDKQIKVFTETGVQVEPIGRPGPGPGEFTSLSAAGVVGEVIFGWDSSIDRLALFNSEGVFDRALPLAFQGNPKWSRVRAMDDSLLVTSGWVMGAQDRELGAVFDLDGNLVARFGSFSDALDRAGPGFLQHTAYYASGAGGVVFSAIHGMDTIVAHDLTGQMVGAGRIELLGHDPVLDLPTLVEESGGTLRQGDRWVHDGHFAILELVALAQDVVAVQYGRLDLRSGTDLMASGGPVVVLQLQGDGVIRKIHQTMVPGRLLGARESGDGLVLRWEGMELEVVTLFALSLRPEG